MVVKDMLEFSYKQRAHLGSSIRHRPTTWPLDLVQMPYLSQAKNLWVESQFSFSSKLVKPKVKNDTLQSNMSTMHMSLSLSHSKSKNFIFWGALHTEVSTYSVLKFKCSKYPKVETFQLQTWTKTDDKVFLQSSSSTWLVMFLEFQ